MRIDEYLETLPTNLINGEDAHLSEKSLLEIFKLVDLQQDDVFYHLGCSNEKSIKIAIEEFGVQKAVGIDNNQRKIEDARKNLGEKNKNGKLICSNIEESDFSDASVILFWFADEKIINKMMKKFKELKTGTKIITVWGPLPNCLPDEIDFPYVVNKIPFKKANSMQEQLLSIFKVKCVDFVTAWEFAERYTKAIGDPEIKNDRFLTIIQTLIIWLNAKKLGVACGDEIPESIRTYISIMKVNFDMDFSHMLDE